jgi:hypothetical protein
MKRTGTLGVSPGESIGDQAARGPSSSSQARLHPSIESSTCRTGLASQLVILFEKARPLFRFRRSGRCSAPRKGCQRSPFVFIPDSPQAIAHHHNFDKVFCGESRQAAVKLGRRAGTRLQTTAMLLVKSLALLLYTQAVRRRMGRVRRALSAVTKRRWNIPHLSN